MSITASIIVEDAPQIDGRRHMCEQHTDHLGALHLIRYVAGAGDDVQARMLARVAQIESQLVAAEIAKDIAIILATDPGGDYSGVTAQHADIGDVRAALRAFYQSATGDQVGRMAAFLLTLSDAQLRAIFNMTQQQVNQLRTRLQARVDALLAVLAATGE